MAHEDNPWAKEAEENASRSKRSNVVNMVLKERSDGEPNDIRILPAKSKGAKPFFKYTVHWLPMRNAAKNRPVFHAVDNKCPLCKAVSSLWSEIHQLKEEGKSEKDPEVKKVQASITQIKGKVTYDMNVIDRGDYTDDEGRIKIKRLVAGPTIWKQLLDLGNSKKWGNPSDGSSRGYDVGVTVSGEGRSKEYSLMPDPNRKALTEEELEALATRAYDLEKERPYTSEEDFIEIVSNARLPIDVNVRGYKASKNSSEDDDGDSEAQGSNDDDMSDELPVSKSPKATTATVSTRTEAPAARRQPEMPPVEKDPDPFSSSAPKSSRSQLRMTDDEGEDGLESPDADPESDKEEPTPPRRNRKLPF